MHWCAESILRSFILHSCSLGFWIDFCLREKIVTVNNFYFLNLFRIPNFLLKSQDSYFSISFFHIGPLVRVFVYVLVVAIWLPYLPVNVFVLYEVSWYLRLHVVNVLLCCHAKIDYKLDEASNHKSAKTRQCFVWLVTLTFNLLPKNGFPGLIVEHFYVMFGDPSCIGFWDVV